MASATRTLAAVACGVAVGALCIGCDPAGSLGSQDAASENGGGAPRARRGASRGDLIDVDWRNAIYRSVCGLSDVEVTAGLGEARSVHGIFGVEVVDVAEGDLDGDGTRDAAVLVDCLGADSYRPHVVVVDGAGVLADGSVAPVAGGSVGAGNRPLRIEVMPDGGISVAVLDRSTAGSVEVVHHLGYAPGVLRGGELVAAPGTEVSGVVTAVEASGDGTPVMVLSVTPDDGYRFRAPGDLVALDPDTGAPLRVEALVGRAVTAELGDDAAVSSITALPAGGA